MLAHLVDLTKPLAFVVPGVLSPAECAALVARIEALGPAVAPITRPEGPVLDLGTRNNARVMFDDPDLAALLWGRVRARVPAELLRMRAVGANERFRGYRYHPGQRFAPHYDGSFVRSDEERSLLTLMVYLNEGFEGGETALLDLDETVVPRAGAALLFQHPILHEGCAVTRGVKYALRTDVMYRQAAA
jgi:predicted 2-oxoglutarate/Fe(II)-dependent dioxygenase YbiX